MKNKNIATRTLESGGEVKFLLGTKAAVDYFEETGRNVTKIIDDFQGKPDLDEDGNVTYTPNGQKLVTHLLLAMANNYVFKETGVEDTYKLNHAYDWMDELGEEVMEIILEVLMGPERLGEIKAEMTKKEKKETSTTSTTSA